MYKTRVIPCLLLDGRRLVKTVRFRDPTYVGDPINAVKIFNDKFVDEIIFLDISASREGRGPDFTYIEEITSECFIPFCYGGGVRSAADAATLFGIGVEKVAINTATIQQPALVEELAARFGSQSIVVAMDVKRGWLGRYTVMTTNGSVKTGLDPVTHARELERQGAGELLVNSVDKDGTMTGYDLGIITEIAAAINIPVIASGGAGHIEHFREATEQAGVSAVAAGSLFVFKGKHRAVLINYPERSVLQQMLA